MEAARANLAALKAQVAAERSGELATLPGKYGFEDLAAFIAAVREAAGDGKRRGRKPGAAKAAETAGGGKGTPRKKRTPAVITDDTRSQVKRLVNDGKTGGEIAKALGISLPSVQNIKKALGLVREAKK